MHYLDTSVLIAALTPEANSAKVHDWLSGRAGLSISAWVRTEVSSALAIQMRTGRLSLEHRADALTVFNRLIDESLVVEPVEARHFEIAARFVDQHELGLRAGDALHLAVASQRGLVLATLDHKLAEAGPKLGAATLLLQC
jgi:predicted nucleic acid-binding protein